MADLKQLLDEAHTLAVFGASARPHRTSHRIAAYLHAAGFRILPVNPTYDEVLGLPCYPDLDSIPDDVSIDMVVVFRRPSHSADAVRQAAARAARTGERPVIWTQPGASSSEARRLAEEAGLTYVADACTMVVHRSAR